MCGCSLSSFSLFVLETAKINTKSGVNNIFEKNEFKGGKGGKGERGNLRDERASRSQI